MKKFPVNFIALTLLLVSVFFCGCTPEPKKEKLQIVVSIAPLSFFAERIGGPHVAVSVMVPPGGNPHSYEPTPRQMSRLGDATLFIKAGSGVEFELDWMQRFLSLNPALKLCNAVEGVHLLAIKHDEEDGAHDHGRYDPHYWLSPANGIIIAKNVERALVEADPLHKNDYAANCATLVAELQVLDQEIHRQLAGVKNRRFLVFHPAWGYYADAYGLEQVAAENEGKTLTPRQMIRVIEKAKANRIKVMLVSPQFSSAQAAAIAREIGGVTRSVDPLASDYIENLQRTTTTFIESM
ncbi:MAG: ABC transporter substrate-binding protein [Chlorobium sp.]|nr:MAG: ABC transporter substrate-binding protein [Chlorobium sp.]